MIRRKIILFLFYITISLPVWSQLEYTMHFARNSPQSAYTNPAFRTAHKHHVTLPSVMYNYGNNAFSYDDLIKRTEGGDSVFIDGDKVISQMKDRNLIVMQTHVDILGVNFSFKKWYFSLLFSEKIDAQFTYPKALAQLIWDGNAQFIGQTIDIGPGVNATYYKDLSLGVSYSFEKLDVGGRIRMLNGVSNIYSRKHNLSLTTSPGYYNTTLSTDYEVHTSGLETSDEAATKAFQFNYNPGMAIDLGLNMHFTEKFQMGLSVIDLGQMTWNREVKTWRSNGSFEYTGVDVNELIDNKEVVGDKYRDSLRDIYFQETEGGSYKSNLIPKVFLSGMYFFNPTTSVGAMVNLEFFQRVHPGFSIYAGKELSAILDAGVSYNIKNGQYFNLGGYAALGPRAVKFFVASDNLVSMFNLNKAQTVTVRFGINVNLNRRDKQKPAIESEEPETSGDAGEN